MFQTQVEGLLKRSLPHTRWMRHTSRTFVVMIAPHRDDTVAESEDYFRPVNLTDALAYLAARPCTVIAGCTDVFPANVGRKLRGPILDISAIDDARGIMEYEDHDRIGALTTWAEIADATLPRSLDALKSAARQIGGVQIQNRGTLGGNLCNASPAADGVPPLLSVDAMVELRSRAGARTIPLEQFITGNRRTVRAADELLTAIIVPKCSDTPASVFLKLGARAYQVISIVMVAAFLAVDSSRCIAKAGIAVGSCSAMALRLPDLERELIGLPISALNLDSLIQPDYLSALSPISDVRGMADYRSDAALTLLTRALLDVQEQLS